MPCDTSGLNRLFDRIFLAWRHSINECPRECDLCNVVVESDWCRECGFECELSCSWFCLEEQLLTAPSFFWR